MFKDWLTKQAIAVLVPVLGGALSPYLTTEAKKVVIERLKVAVKASDSPLDDYAVAQLAAAWGV
jgi:hypothetical protein